MSLPYATLPPAFVGGIAGIAVALDDEGARVKPRSERPYKGAAVRSPEDDPWQAHLLETPMAIALGKPDAETLL